MAGKARKNNGGVVEIYYKKHALARMRKVVFIIIIIKTRISC